MCVRGVWLCEVSHPVVWPGPLLPASHPAPWLLPLLALFVTPIARNPAVTLCTAPCRCVLQFPLRSATHDMPDVTTVKLRPKLMHLELATALNTTSGTFDADKPQLPHMKEMVHTSSAVPCCTSSAVGNFKDGGWWDFVTLCVLV